jgi:hypothetical protein
MARCNEQARKSPAGGVMGPKLLFVLGIVATHGALGAAWMRTEVSEPRGAATTCVNAPAPLPYFQPQSELLAMQVSAVASAAPAQP